MNQFENACREFALGRVQSFAAGKSEGFCEYLAYAYLGRLVMIVNDYQKTKITEGPAIDQFMALAKYIQEKTGRRVIDQIFNGVNLLVDSKLEQLESEIVDDDRRQVSSIVTRMVPS